ncbi:MAG: tRNA (guanosine(37)-N1)-methyltransferase TrmD, partial [Bradyrhizobium sp.]
MTVSPIIWRATVLTLFPEMFPGPLGVSLAGRALGTGLWALEVRDIRASATDRHRSVDDTPAGGGLGMVLRADVLAAAIDAANIADRPRLLMSPRGRPLT